MTAIDLARTVPGHVSLVIEAADEATAHAMAAELAACHNVTGPTALWRVPGEDGVRIRLHGHLEPVGTDAG